MGGKAFSHGPEPLLTPRMPPAIYRCLLDRFHVKLGAFFQQVASPIEAPGKATFGDVDLLVAGPRDPHLDIAAVAKALNAKRTLSYKPVYSLAVPYPGLEGSFVQLDVQVCKPDHFEWELFHKSHGDLWNLLGTSIRPFGLTANDTGLYLRIPEIDYENRKRALVFLTADPGTVLDFLALDKKSSSQPFDSIEAMFDFACSCRFFRPQSYERSGLKSNDRKRIFQREIFRQFVEDFLPGRTMGVQHKDYASGLTREDVFDEALRQFGIREEVETRIRDWRQERDEKSQTQAARRWRKEQAMDDDAYTDAWMQSLDPSYVSLRKD
ncbi:MAG: hypothetical protein Q9169_002035 [Polycauliona sp. 2 TL-2023]